MHTRQVFKVEVRSRQPRHLSRQRGEESLSLRLDNKSSFIVRPVDMDERKVSGSAKNDLWVLSSSPYFSEEARGHTAVCRSVWFGMGKDGCIELMHLSGASMTSFADGGTAYILRGPNVTGEWDMMENLRGLSPGSAPLLPFLITGAPPPAAAGGILRAEVRLRVDLGGVDVEAEVAQCTADFGLNCDQTRILQRFARIVTHPEEEQPVVLIHGVFGSGKSTLLVVSSSSSIHGLELLFLYSWS